MHVEEQTDQRLVLTETNLAGPLFAAAAIIGALTFAVPAVQQGEYETIIVPLIVAAGVLVFAATSQYRTRIAFDRSAGTVEVIQRRLLGSRRDQEMLLPGATVEIDEIVGESNKRNRRLVLTSGDKRLPFSRRYTNRDYGAERNQINAWLSGE